MENKITLKGIIHSITTHKYDKTYLNSSERAYFYFRGLVIGLHLAEIITNEERDMLYDVINSRFLYQDCLGYDHFR